MGCAVQQEPASNEKSSAAAGLKTESLKVPSNQCSLKKSPNDSNSSSIMVQTNIVGGKSSSSNNLKKAHSALVKILEAAPLNSSNSIRKNPFNEGAGGSGSNNSNHNNSNSQVVVVSKEETKICVLANSPGAESGSTSSQTEDTPAMKIKATPKIDFCPWKKTTIAKEWISACKQELQKQQQQQQEQQEKTSSESATEEAETRRYCAITAEQHHSTASCRSRESSQSSDHSSLSASPEPTSDDSCSNSNSDCCSDYLINDLCKQFEENLCEDHGFFRRSIQQKIQYRPCTKNQQCSILRINRNRCQYCRLKKCIAVGMSRDAVRFGRVPKREKARILAAMQQSTQNRGNQRALATELDDQPRLLAAVLRAHMETCEFTQEKVGAMRQRARDCPTYSMPTLACPLNPAPELQSEQEFSQRFAHVIRGVIDFAGMIPGFQLLTQDDKFTLLKAGLFDALFVRLICMFDSQINSIICLNGQVMRRDTIQNGANARFLVDSTFNFAERMNSMNLTDAEIGLFCAIVLITPDRPGLRNVELIERMYSKLKACLQSIVSQNRPDKPEFMQELLRTLPDLRTLSTLHTEKLVVFRTEHKELLRQQMWSAEEELAKSPGSNTWSCDGNNVEDVAKSPMSSVSSTESAETTSDYSHTTSSLSASAPLLAATLSGQCPIRHRASSGSSAEDDIIGGAAHLAQNGLTITPVIRSVGGTHHVRYRKLDSPTDSGIESGNEKHDHKPVSSGSSSCSSPRSSLEDQSDDKRHIVENMPVLKRVLQAPPLYDTNSLMDEAYKPHKKFRAMRHRESEAEPAPSSSSSSTITLSSHSPKPSSSSSSSPSSVAVVSSHSSSSGAAQSPPQQPQSQLHMHLTRPMHQSPHQSLHHHHHHLHNHQLTPPASHHQSSSLSSTHSVLAKSLMEQPTMTPEQMKRSDIIHNYIMRESQHAQHNHQHHQQQPQQQHPESHGPYRSGLLVCSPRSSSVSPLTSSSSSSSSSSSNGGCPFTSSNANGSSNSNVVVNRWQSGPASVITTTRQQTPSPSLNSTGSADTSSSSSSSSSCSSIRYFQSPHSTSISPPVAAMAPASTTTGSIGSPQPLAAVSAPSPSPRLLELQVDIAGGTASVGHTDAPLNLSKKSPSPSPARSNASANATATSTIHKVLLEA
ncbi:ecdysone-inducible protein E75 isoform X2 [Toxorhynchites rutilus septentrionalis]|uniref:ecdysone-inducible protein E75 isoform X2 n=1 Tax=Toxorhynchites rutilus septentrionalis TaxID=329112 RepID=UPI002478ED70|nr:ecdysone-inducible protein E75 isoform X2 [Toxorhynchites rutilus septentrionalis]